jgi:hypothetical protein
MKGIRTSEESDKFSWSLHLVSLADSVAYGIDDYRKTLFKDEPLTEESEELVKCGYALLDELEKISVPEGIHIKEIEPSIKRVKEKFYDKALLDKELLSEMREYIEKIIEKKITEEEISKLQEFLDRIGDIHIKEAFEIIEKPLEKEILKSY